MLHFALIKLVRFVVVRVYLTMMKKMNVSLSNGLVVNRCRYKCNNIFVLRVEIGGYFKKGIRGMTIRIWRGGEATLEREWIRERWM